MDNYSSTIKNHTRITVTSKKTGETQVLLETKEEGNVVGDVLAGIPITESMDDSLDSLTFTIKEGRTKKLFKPFDIVTFTLDDGETVSEYEMCVLSDHAHTLSSKNGTFTHVVTVIESTKILEKTKIFNLNLTNPYDTLLRQLEKALANAEPVIRTLDENGNVLAINHECRFVISDELRELLKNIPGEDFWFGNTDLRTVLDGILAPCNARVKVKKIDFKKLPDGTANVDKILIGYRKLSEVKTVEPVWTKDEQGEIVREELSNNGQDYAGKIVARGYNTHMDEPLELRDYIKTDENTLSDTNACIFLPFPIGDKGVVELSITVKYAAYYEHGIEKYIYRTAYIPMLPMEQYELLPESDKRNYIPYVIGSTRIQLGAYTSSKLGFQTLNIVNLIREQTENIYNNWFENYFRINYYPQLDTAIDLSKQNVYDKDELLAGIMDSQTENNLDVTRHGKKLESLIKRTGNDEYYIDVTARHYGKLLPLMSKIKMPEDNQGYSGGDYVLYKRECGVYDMFVKCRYYFSKDFNAVQKVAGINREKHLYDIPLESDECPIIIKKYMVFGSEPMNGDGSVDNSLIKTAVGGTFLDTERAGIVSSFIITSRCGEEVFPRDTENSQGEKPYSADYCFFRSCVAYGQGRTINFVAKPLDNYSMDYGKSGYYFSIWGDGGHKITYNRYVSKEKETAGECDRFNIYLAYNSELAENPVALKTDFVTAMNNPMEVLYNKDRTQKPVFYYTFECCASETDFGKIFIGSSFCKYNNLVQGHTLEDLFVVYSFEKEFNELPEIIPSNYLIISDDYEPTDELFVGRVENSVYLYDVFGFQEGEDGAAGLIYNGNFLNNESVKSWAIINMKGEVFIAVSGKFKSVYAAVKTYAG